MDKVKEVVNKVIHPNEAKHADTTGTHTTGSHTTGTHSNTGHGAGVTGTSGTAGPHSSNLANKADPRVDSDLDGSRNAGAAQYGTGAHNAGNTHNTGVTGQYDTAGPHSSNLANKVDPRVDSDLDGSRNAGAARYGTGAHNTHGNTGLTGSNTGATGYSSNTTGPHSSNLANKLDPRVDSDNDGSRNLGGAQYGAGAHQTHNAGLTGNNHGTTGSGLTGSHNTHGTTGAGTGLTGGYGTSTGGHGHSTNAGPHDSNLANKVDPRVDSDRDGSRNVGAAQYGPGGAHNTSNTSGGLTGSNNYGSNTGSGLTGTHGTHGHSGVGGLNDGPAPNTAGPHKSDLLNKVDPRVDSDHSKTGGAPQY